MELYKANQKLDATPYFFYFVDQISYVCLPGIIFSSLFPLIFVVVCYSKINRNLNNFKKKLVFLRKCYRLFMFRDLKSVASCIPGICVRVCEVCVCVFACMLSH